MGEGAVLANSPAKSWLEINQQLTSPAKFGVFVDQLLLPINLNPINRTPAAF